MARRAVAGRMPRTIERKGPAVDIPSGFAVEPGTIAWVQTEGGREAEDVLVTAAFAFLARPSGMTPEQGRELGRSLGRASEPGCLERYLLAFSHLGMSVLTVAEDSDVRFVFLGHAQADGNGAGPVSCGIALGFLEGAVQATTGHPTRGA